jgi:hypothetical protein
MKLLSVEDAQTRLAAVCQEALAGEVIRLQMADGGLLELSAVRAVSLPAPVSTQQLESCYQDEDWALFESRCGKASD